MTKAFVMVVCILAVVVLAQGSRLDEKISNYIDRASSNIECHLGSDDACVRSFYLEHQTEIWVGAGIALLLLVGCCVCCGRCCGREKRGLVYVQMPRPATTANAYKV